MRSCELDGNRSENRLLSKLLKLSEPIHETIASTFLFICIYFLYFWLNVASAVYSHYRTSVQLDFRVFSMMGAL